MRLLPRWKSVKNYIICQNFQNMYIQFVKYFLIFTLKLFCHLPIWNQIFVDEITQSKDFNLILKRFALSPSWFVRVFMDRLILFRGEMLTKVRQFRETSARLNSELRTCQEAIQNVTKVGFDSSEQNNQNQHTQN